MKITTKFWIGLGALGILSPLGIYLPEKAKAGSAWGEWGSEEVKELVGYVPAGLERLSSLWNAPLPDYALKGMEQAGLGGLSLTYILSAVIGMGLCVAAAYFLGKILFRRKS